MKRLSELERDNKIKAVGVVECEVSGRKVTMWEINEKTN